MRLDPDCVRDILFVVEELTGWRKPITFPAHFPDEVTGKYSKDTLSYHIDQCYMNGLLMCASRTMTWDRAGNTVIKGLSPKGHEFIENIRSDNTWSKVKQAARIAGSFSLKVLVNLAAQAITSH